MALKLLRVSGDSDKDCLHHVFGQVLLADNSKRG